MTYGLCTMLKPECNQAMKSAVYHIVGWFQASVHWDGCGKNGIQHKISGWDVGFSCFRPRGCSKQVAVTQ